MYTLLLLYVQASAVKQEEHILWESSNLFGHLFDLCAGGAGAALASQIAAGACTQLGLLLQHSAARMASASVLAVPEGTPPALQAPPNILPPPAIAKLNANLLQFAYVPLTPHTMPA